jgi:hypothetical protein
LIAHREEARLAPLDGKIVIRGRKHRAEITAAKEPMLQAAIDIINARKQFRPISIRAIHYALLNSPPLRHASKRDSKYRNDSNSYNDLVELLTRARIAGRIPMATIGDETRPVTTWTVYENTRLFIQTEINGFLKGYWRDLMKSQSVHVKIVVEKNTVHPILADVAMKYCIPITSGRGYSSLPPRAANLCSTVIGTSCG